MLIEIENVTGVSFVSHKVAHIMLPLSDAGAEHIAKPHPAPQQQEPYRFPIAGGETLSRQQRQTAGAQQSQTAQRQHCCGRKTQCQQQSGNSHRKRHAIPQQIRSHGTPTPSGNQRCKSGIRQGKQQSHRPRRCLCAVSKGYRRQADAQHTADNPPPEPSRSPETTFPNSRFCRGQASSFLL